MILFVKQSGTGLKMYKESDTDSMFHGHWSMLFGNYKAKIFNNQNALLYSIRKRFKLFKLETTYEIKANNGRHFVLKSMNGKHSILRLHHDKDIYEIRIHKGRDKSIFLNGKQVAKMTDSVFEILGKDKIEIEADYDINVEIIFLLIICLRIGEGGELGATFDLGQLGKMEEANKRWKPKSKNTTP